VPKTKTEVALPELALQLRAAGIPIEADTPFLLVCQFCGMPVSIAKNGKVMIRNTADEAHAKKIFKELLERVKGEQGKQHAKE